jgi:hypothetical protein
MLYSDHRQGLINAPVGEDNDWRTGLEEHPVNL